MMKKQIWLTSEQRDLLIDIVTQSHSVIREVHLKESSGPITRMCAKYCDKRTQEVLDILTGNPATPK